VSVVRRTYSPLFRCTLYKNDGSRKDGFEGVGGTIEDAINQAVAGCHSTNNPYCSQYGNDPNHTTCKFDVAASEAVTEYDADKLPDITGAVSAYTCSLKSSGARAATYYGTGASEQDARTAAANSCNKDNLFNCLDLSKNPDYTTCGGSYLIDGPRPSMLWSCSLYKNDGSRRDGFEGQGDSIDEARNKAAAVCKSTNNPYCDAYAKDPAHTKCATKVVYPGQ